MKQLEKNVADFFFKNDLCRSSGIVLAVSGGADSTALMVSIRVLKNSGVFNGRVLCVHINHCLRGQESDRDESFVRDLAAQMKFEFIAERVDVKTYAQKNKLSIETAARKLRLDALIKNASKNDILLIATAHHADDNAETILQRLSRGTGLRGLCGIWPKKNFADDITFIRPLLSTRREQIISYLRQGGFSWQNDSTNEQCEFRRNFIRHKLLPALQSESKAPLVEKLEKLSSACRRLMQKVSIQADIFCTENLIYENQQAVLKTLGLDRLDRETLIEILRRTLELTGCGLQNISSTHYNRIIDLIDKSHSGREVELNSRFAVRYEYGQLLFFKKQEKDITKKTIIESIELNIPGTTYFDNYKIDTEIIDRVSFDLGEFYRSKDEFCEIFDFDKLKLPLNIGPRKGGERFFPLGHAAEKKIGKFLTDQRVSKNIRDISLLLSDQKSVIWLWPIRISDEYKVTKTTKKLLLVHIKSKRLQAKLIG